MEEKVLPRLFIGSSSEGLEVAESLQLLLEPHCECTAWHQGVFGLGDNTINALMDAVRNHDFAVLVLTPDDMVRKREVVRPAARDNVLLELGLFLGALGPKRTFIVHRRGDKIDIPTDLEGITRATYNLHRDGNMMSSLGSVVTQIKEAIRKAPPVQHSTNTNSAAGRPLDDNRFLRSVDLPRHLRDLLEGIAKGRAGLSLEVKDSRSLDVWVNNLLGMLHDLYLSRQADVYALWLRPLETDASKLRVYRYRNLKKEYLHYEFGLGEGLAGRVWSTGTPAAQSVLRQHPWWVFREGCENVSYICVPVGEPAGIGGVLSIGSDLGFQVEDQDVEVVGLFASLLHLAIFSPESRAMLKGTKRNRKPSA